MDRFGFFGGSMMAPKTTSSLGNVNDLEKVQLDLGSMRYYERRIFLKQLKNEGGFGDLDMDFPSWLIEGTSFESNNWDCRFGTEGNYVKMSVDFNVKLEDGSLLTDAANAQLLRGFKVFLIVQLHPRYNNNRRRQGHTEADIFKCGLKFLDHILMNSERFKLSELGLNLMGKADFTDYLIKKTGFPASTHLYNYPTKLAVLLREVSLGIGYHDIELLTDRFPFLDDIPSEWERELCLSDEELLRARAYIYNNALYKTALGMKQYNSASFTKVLYANTLAGKSLMPKTFPELNEGFNWKTEFPPVPVRNESTVPVSKKMLRRHYSVVLRMSLAQRLVPALNFNFEVLQTLSFSSVYKRVLKKVEGNFRSLPGEVVYKLIRDSYAYIKNNSKKIFWHVIARAFDNKLRGRYVKANHRSVCNDNMRIGLASNSDKYECWLTPFSERDEGYYDYFRSDKILHDSFVTLMGAYFIVIGALTARRQGELLGMMEGSCLEPNKNPNLAENKSVHYEIGFMAGKTGDRHAKEFLSVPIPRMVAKLLWALKEVHQDCVRLGLISKSTPLLVFLRPDNISFRQMCPTTYNACLSTICDFTQTPTIALENGQVARFYVRQHQLRRFFAMAFFAAAGFKDLDALRAFLGHSDIQHLYTYIVEITPGAMLQSVKTEALTKAVLSGNSTIEHLNTLKHTLCKMHEIHDLTIKTLPELRLVLEKAAASAHSPSADDLAKLSHSEIYSDVKRLVASKLIDLVPTHARLMAGNGAQTDVHLMVRINQ
jgi:integrase